jgi:MinD-like ATPase involved in chromosome partitioning or flagellar assembly
MTVIAVCSAKHSPGATTFALALVTAWASTSDRADSPPVLVEADPSGGDLAARLGLAADPGLVSMAAAARHPTSDIDLVGHAQPLPCGGVVILGPTNPDQAEAAVATLASRLSGGLGERGRGVIDLGRWGRASGVSDVMRAADLTLIVTRPDVAGVAHLRERIDAMRGAAGGRLGVVLVGERPYGVQSVKDTLGHSMVMTVAVDRDGAQMLLGRARARSACRSQLVRSVRSVLDAVAAVPVASVTA